MAKIIISYRRADSAAITGRIRDRLVSHYGASLVFMDVEDPPFGSDFRDHIRELLRSDLLLVVVGGNGWARMAMALRVSIAGRIRLASRSRPRFRTPSP
jgi:hypothetical protein